MNNPKNIPRHVAIIMDVNGRWARSRGLPKIMGHRAGVKSAEEAVRAAGELGIKVLTLYTFSTENWKRPKREIDALFGLLEEYLDKAEDKFNKNNIRFSVIGNTEGLPESVRKKLKKVITLTKNNTGLTLNLALNYGSRSEIVNAARNIAKDVLAGSLAAEKIDDNLFSTYLYTKDLPDPDLLIRTSGEFRVSNFLLWQISYAELHITKKLWPDFKKQDLRKAIAEYQRRERRFGG
ncbi:MAG: isoprenyl transferase [Candidatus Omnitrophica bacterium]|nr:isoprenyl transferase [Candidatus Omnitrophota bacterium]